MMNEVIFMNGYGLYVWAAFSFTLISFATLYVLIKINLYKTAKLINVNEKADQTYKP